MLNKVKLFSCSAKNKQKIIPSDHKELIRGIVRFKDGLEKSVENYDHLPLPPIYNQVRKLSDLSEEYLYYFRFIFTLDCNISTQSWTMLHEFELFMNGRNLI